MPILEDMLGREGKRRMGMPSPPPPLLDTCLTVWYSAPDQHSGTDSHQTYRAACVLTFPRRKPDSSQMVPLKPEIGGFHSNIL